MLGNKAGVDEGEGYKQKDDLTCRRAIINMSKQEQESALLSALRHFEVAEANLAKLERLCQEIKSLIPDGVNFNENSEYEDKCRSFDIILPHLPKINGWRPSAVPLELNNIAQSRMDANDVGEIEAVVSIEEAINAPGRELRDYRFLLNQKRREMVRDALEELIDFVDADIRIIKNELEAVTEQPSVMGGESWDRLKDHIAQIDTLLGSGAKPLARWSDLHRHLHFATLHDFNDVDQHDWPSVKGAIRASMYGENEPIPSKVGDLSELVSNKPSGPITSKLHWERLAPEEFERLMFSLISAEKGYDNPQWLTQTNAPDRGRDLSVERVVQDPLGGVMRHRVIIQCKHWLKKSVSIRDVKELEAQMKLWEPPRVDVHIISTSGRFASDAVALIERHNQSDRALRIEMWPETHLEMLLASRPALIAEFGLR